MPMDEFVRELLTADGSTFSNPAANYYRISRDPESSVETTAQLFLGRPHPVRQVPQPPVRAVDAGRLLRLRRLLLPGRQKHGGLPEEEVIYSTGSGEVRQPRTGEVMPPKALGGPVLDDDGQDRPSRPARLVADRPREPVLRQEPGQPDLVSPDGPGDRRSGRRLPRLEPRLQRRAARRPGRRTSSPAATTSGRWSGRSSRAGPTSSRRTTNELNADDAIYFSHAYTKLLPAEVLLDAISTVTGTHDHVQRPARRRPGHPDPRRQDGQPVPQDLRPPGPRAGLRMRARERLEPVAGAAAHRRRDGQRQAPRRQRPDRQARQERQAPRGRSPRSSTWSPSPASPTPPSWRPPSST